MCEQLNQLLILIMKWEEVEPATSGSRVQCSNHKFQYLAGDSEAVLTCYRVLLLDTKTSSKNVQLLQKLITDNHCHILFIICKFVVL